MPKTSVDAYIAEAPAEQTASLLELRAMIQSALPDARETISNSGFPVYTSEDGDWLAGFATRKKCPMLYIMAAGILDHHEAQLGPLRSGRSCIDWRASKSLSLDELRELAATMLSEIRTR